MYRATFTDKKHFGMVYREITISASTLEELQEEITFAKEKRDLKLLRVEKDDKIIWSN